MYMQCYMTTTGILRITDTLQYIPKAFFYPKTTTEDYLQQAIGYIIVIMNNPPKKLPFFSYGDAKKAINQISHILHRSISQPRFTNLTIATTAATDSEWKISGSEYPQHTSSISKGGTSFATSEGATTSSGTHTNYKNTEFHTTQLGSRSESMD